MMMTIRTGGMMTTGRTVIHGKPLKTMLPQFAVGG